MPSFFQQIHSNLVALISLTVALGALGYNSWRNEKTEDQRNIRLASFQVLENLGEMQEIVDARYYYLAFDQSAGDESSLRLKGFGNAAMSRDLMGLMPPPAPAAGAELHATWVRHFNHLDELDAKGKHTSRAVAAEEELRLALERSRAVVMQALANLD